jgi:hypothetical protein
MTRPLPEFVEHACELFAPLGSIRVRAMFGGWGFYCDEIFFAIVADETVPTAFARPVANPSASPPGTVARKP